MIAFRFIWILTPYDLKIYLYLFLPE